MAKSSRVFDKLVQEYLQAKQEESQLPAPTDNTPNKIIEAELEEPVDSGQNRLAR